MKASARPVATVPSGVHGGQPIMRTSSSILTRVDAKGHPSLPAVIVPQRGNLNIPRTYSSGMNDTTTGHPVLYSDETLQSDAPVSTATKASSSPGPGAVTDSTTVTTVLDYHVMYWAIGPLLVLLLLPFLPVKLIKHVYKHRTATSGSSRAQHASLRGSIQEPLLQHVVVRPGPVDQAGAVKSFVNTHGSSMPPPATAAFLVYPQQHDQPGNASSWESPDVATPLGELDVELMPGTVDAEETKGAASDTRPSDSENQSGPGFTIMLLNFMTKPYKGHDHYTTMSTPAAAAAATSRRGHSLSLPVPRRLPICRSASTSDDNALPAPEVPFQRFSEDAVRLVSNAMNEATLASSPEVMPVHLFPAAVALRGEPAARALVAVGASANSLRNNSQSNNPMGNLINQMTSKNNVQQVPLARSTLEVLANAGVDPVSDSSPITSLDVMEAALDDASAVECLYSAGVDPQALAKELSREREEVEEAEEAKGKKGKKMALVGGGRKKRFKKSVLAQHSVDLDALAREGALDPCVGRDDEVERMMTVLVRRRKANPCLVGDPGVGKTALVEGLAQRIAEGNAPQRLKGKRVISLDLGSLLSDTKYRGEFEQRLKSVVEEVTMSKDIILFIDELHMLIGAGGTGDDGGMDAANLLKPALARGELQCVGATTLVEYRKHIEKDAALERRFQPVDVVEPTEEQAIQICTKLSERYGEHHDVQYESEAIEAAVKLSSRFINDRFLPDKAIDVMDEAGARKQMTTFGSSSSPTDSSTSVVDPDDVARVVSQWSGVPVSKLSSNDRTALLSLEDELHRRVIGQDEAVSALARAVRRARSGLAAKARPIATLIFAGPTGVGKTELVKAVAAAYYGSESAMIRLDMSEYMEAHTVSRLVGPPPGYVGFDDGGQLTDAVRRTPYAVVLLDEAEKAHPDVFNILLQVLEDGRLTDGKGRVVDFTNTMIVMTSNLGSRQVLETAKKSTNSSSDGDTTYSKMRTAVLKALQSHYRPEFLNRLDEILVFRPLSRPEAKQVAVLMVRDVARRAGEQGVNLDVTPALVDRIVDQGFSDKFGARPMRRTVQRYLEDVIAESLLVGLGDSGGLSVDVAPELNTVCVTANDGTERYIQVTQGAGIEEDGEPAQKSSSTTTTTSSSSEGDGVSDDPLLLAAASILASSSPNAKPSPDR